MYIKQLLRLNVENGAVVDIDQIIQKSCGLVVIGVVIEGDFSKGDRANIQASGENPINDEICRIELYGEEILSAHENQKVGILLKTTSKDELVQHLKGAA